MLKYLFIENTENFKNIISNLKKSPFISIDTESDSLYSYYEKLCLLQIASNENIYLIDTLKVEISELKEIFADKRIRKIFHSADSDMPLIKNLIKGEFNNIFDVMLAAKYCGIYRCGLANLIEKFFSVKLNKKYQKANWGYRPIMTEMLEYAAMDVYYLKNLKDILITELKKKNLFDEFLSHCEYITKITHKKYEFDPEGYFNINGFKYLNQRQISVLRNLYIKREEIAQKWDRPPFKIISNEVMLKISQKPQEALNNLKSFKGISDYILQKHSNWILQAIKDGLNSEIINYEKKKKPYILDKDITKTHEIFEKLRSWRQVVSKRRDLFPELILNNEQLWKIARNRPQNHQELKSLNIPEFKIKIYEKEILELLSASKITN